MYHNFVRHFTIDLINESLAFHQKFEGDVSCVVWDAAIVLAKYLEALCSKHRGYLENVNIVELGSGLGCVGLTAACLGANVTLTDLPEALPLLKLNVESNEIVWKNCGGSVEVKSLSWGKTELDVVPDLILLADCVYYKESILPLIQTLKHLSGPKTKILLTQEMRESEIQKNHWEEFIEEIKKCFNVAYVPIEEQHSEYSSPDILLLKLKKT